MTVPLKRAETAADLARFIEKAINDAPVEPAYKGWSYEIESDGNGELRLHIYNPEGCTDMVADITVTVVGP